MTDESGGPPGDAPPAPLGFKLLVGLAAVYLLLRLIQMAGWLIGKLS